MTERWRAPVVPLEINQTLDAEHPQGIWLPDGRTQTVPELVLKREDVERMRTGYVCAKCFEPFEHAWPEKCNCCGAPVRSEQAAYFAREFGGEVQLGPTTTLEEELGRLDEYRRKEEEEERAKHSHDQLG